MNVLRKLNGTHSRRGSRGLTIIEFSIATTIALIVFAGMFVFVSMASRSMQGVTMQNDVNQAASHGAEFILERVRVANTLATASSGNTLTLSFDDNPDVDSDGDGKTYNDRDHYEQFTFSNVDGSDSTTDDNKITYMANVSTAASVNLVAGRVRKLPSTPIFTITNTSRVLVNFGLVDSYTNDFFQALEIKTSAVRRNYTN